MSIFEKAKKLNLPNSKREEVAEEIHGQKILDHYRWLENSESSEVKNWIFLCRKKAMIFLFVRDSIF